MSQIITLWSDKGGTGKSMIAAMVASAEWSKPVAVVDLDPRVRRDEPGDRDLLVGLLEGRATRVERDAAGIALLASARRQGENSGTEKHGSIHARTVSTARDTPGDGV